MSKLQVQQPVIKLNLYRIMSDAIAEGLRLGYQRAHKHTDDVNQEDLFEAQEDAIMIALEEYIQFGEPEEE